MSETLEVWIDAASVGELTRVGKIAHDRGHVRFQYDRAWLTHPRCFDIDPDLSLDQATFPFGVWYITMFCNDHESLYMAVSVAAKRLRIII